MSQMWGSQLRECRELTLVSRERGARSKGYLEGWTWKQGGIGGASQSLRRGGFTGRRLDVGSSILRPQKPYSMLMLPRISTWSTEEAVNYAGLKFRREV